MRVCMLWLKDYVDLPEPPAQVAQMLTDLGLVVEAMSGEADDCVLDVDVTTNRPDCLSHIGIARELAAVTGRPLRLPDAALPPDTEPVAAAGATVRVEAPDLCPRYTARIVRGVAIGPSPDWMQKRLILAGLRPINNIVDITNFVLLEYGQPLHAFDLDLIADATVIVRHARPQETMRLLDGSLQTLSEDMLVIADAREPVALAGVMGGANSEINSQTCNVLIESALFDRVSIRRTARRLGVSTESSYRFERGVDPVAVDTASRRAARLMQEHAGGAVLSGVIDSNPRVFRAGRIRLMLREVRRILGIEMGKDEAARILKGLGLEVTAATRSSISVRTAPWRADLERPIDLIEEIARLKGYDCIPTAISLRVRAVEKSLPQRLLEVVTSTFLGAGFDEVVTDSFVSSDERELFGVPAALRITNPVRQGQDFLKSSLLPSLLAVLARNRRAGMHEASVFEAGAAYIPGQPGEAPEERRMLAAADTAGCGRIKAAVALLIERIGATAEWRMQPAAGLADGSSMALYMDGIAQGVCGIAADKAAGFYGLERGAGVFECRLDALVAAYRQPQFEGLPRFPAVQRDVAVVVPEGLPWLAVEHAIRANAPPELVYYRFGEVYRGPQAGPAHKSFMFSLTYRHPEKTLSADAANQLHERFMAAFLKQVNGRLRAPEA